MYFSRAISSFRSWQSNEINLREMKLFGSQVIINQRVNFDVEVVAKILNTSKFNLIPYKSALISKLELILIVWWNFRLISHYECDFFKTKTEFGNCGVPRITSLFNQKSFEPKFRTKIQNVIISHATTWWGRTRSVM